MRPIFLEGFDGFVTSTAAPIATGWSDPVAGRDSHPLKIRAFSRRTAGFVLRGEELELEDGLDRGAERETPGLPRIASVNDLVRD
jgi:hypothetical protein